MSRLLILLALAGCAFSAPQFGSRFVSQQPTYQPAAQTLTRDVSTLPRPYARILRQDQDVLFDGTFNYGFETENGIVSEVSGQMKKSGTEEAAQVIEGSYSYTAPDGTPVSIRYIADEGGFRAEGAAIPTPPPVPEAIQRALDYIRSLPPTPHNKYQ